MIQQKLKKKQNDPKRKTQKDTTKTDDEAAKQRRHERGERKTQKRINVGTERQPPPAKLISPLPAVPLRSDPVPDAVVIPTAGEINIAVTGGAATFGSRTGRRGNSLGFNLN
ncbi:hypothetical protein QE152_g9087 [Popillia japonica]|uniref:Uncharacterized protein n=1 Tax=Popillia japonica TaxID=7064 RepID=A0AAW1M0S1_POPJA